MSRILRRELVSIALAAGAGIVFQGCGSSSTAANGTLTAKLTNTTLSGTTARVILNPIAEILAGGGLASFAVGDSASSTATSVTSLKYLFGNIELCESITSSGSSFSAGTNCITLYSNSADISSITASTFASNTALVFDLMDTTSLAKFNAAASGTITAGSYNYVTINWSSYIGVTGSVAIGGTTLRTQACTLNTTTGLCKSATSLSSATSNVESITKSANGGSFFKFQNPFVISAADVTAKTAYSVDLVFNPEGAVAATKSLSPSGGVYNGMISDVDPGGSMGNVIYVPMIQLTPVPRKTTDTTSKETYNITLPSNMGTGRVEIYYKKSDTDKTVYGVNVLTTMTTSNNGAPLSMDNGSKITTVTAAADGSLTLKTTDGVAVVTGLARSTNSTVTVNYLGGLSSTAAASATSTYVNTVDLN